MIDSENYLNKGKEVLRILINNGCEAYIIGEAVCKIILKKPFDTLNITTNATPAALKGIFSYTKIADEEEGTVRLHYSGYEFLISTFRAANFRDKRNPKQVHYSKVFHEELANCDFTLNAIAMTYGGKLTDAYRGFNDIQKRIVRSIGSPKVRFSEDPLRILRAIRISSELGFKIEKRTVKAMKARSKHISKLDVSVISKELRKILLGKYLKRALNYMYITRTYKRIPGFVKDFRLLADSFRSLKHDIFLALVFVRNGRYLTEWEGLAEDSEYLKLLVELALTVPKGKYTLKHLFDYGLDICIDANRINVLLKKDRKRKRQITRAFQKLPLKDVRDLAFTGADILQLTSNKEGDYVQILVDSMAGMVLEQKIANTYDALREFALAELQIMGILPGSELKMPPSDPVFDTAPVTSEAATAIPAPLTNAGPSHRPNEHDAALPQSKLQELEQRLFKQERLLRERDLKIEELERITLETRLITDVNSIVGQNLEMLEDMKYIEKGSEKAMVSRELNQLYRRLITNVDPRYRILNKKNEVNNES